MPERKRVNVPKGATIQTSPRKPKLGQHFLASEAAALRIVEALGDVSDATVLEIGPGRGAITDLLARKSRRLIAVELDRVLSAQLRMKFSMQPNVEIIEGDILTIELDTVFGAKPGSLRTGLNFAPEPARVIGNLPYYITSDILLRLLEYHRYFSTIVLMVQKKLPIAWPLRLEAATMACFRRRRSSTAGSSNSSRFRRQRFLHLRKFIRAWFVLRSSLG